MISIHHQKGAQQIAKTKIEKIEGIEEEIRQLENKKKRLIQEQKEQERKDRTNRRYKRMGLFEKLLPDTIPLTEEQFKTFLEQTTEHSRRILAAQNAATAPAQGAGTAARDNNTPSPPPKPPIQRRRAAQTRAQRKSTKATNLFTSALRSAMEDFASRHSSVFQSYQ